MTLPVQLSSDQWINQFFSAQAVGQGGVVRRKAADIDRLAGRERFLREVSLRGFRAVENNGQILVFCNRAPVRILL
ncbi:MAG: N-(5'-phosphoribosyl)anthranilate isomerase [Paracoccaceae bacterium]|nr:N-(5'-phosphoribosyl)anthranilate isomerase [Paracoccaceae bacterium]